MSDKKQSKIAILTIIIMLLISLGSVLKADEPSFFNEEDNNEVLAGVENANVAIDWETSNEELGSNFTITDETGYYEMNLPKGQVKASSSLHLIRGSETIFLYNSSDEYYDISGEPCCLWKNFTLPSKFPKDNSTIMGYAYNESNTSEKIQAEISISFTSYPESCTGFYGFNTTTCNTSGGYEIDLTAHVGVGITAFAEGYNPGYEYIIIGEGVIPNINISLNPITDEKVDCALVKGYIKNITNNEVIDQAKISFFQIKTGNSTYSNSDGYYEINLADGHFDVECECEGYFYNLTMLELICGETKWFNISLYPGPSDNAWVHLYINDSKTGYSIPDAEGTINGEYYECVNQSQPIYDWNFLYYDRILSDYYETGGYYNISVPSIIYDDDFYCTNMSYVWSWSAFAEGYYYNESSDINIIEPGDEKNIELNLEPEPEENCTIKGYVYMLEHRPYANNDSYVTTEDQTLNIMEPGLLINDSDADGDSIIANLVKDVSNGILVLNENGSFEYSPNTNFYGSDSFKYNVSDGKFYSNIATVNITITSENDPPMILDPNPPDKQINVPISLSEINVTIIDPEGDSFNWSIETKPDIGDNSSKNDYDGIKNCSVTGLSYDTTYTWYVNATDQISGKNTNLTYTFTTLSLNRPPYIPTNPSPENNEKDVDIDLTLEWSGGDPDSEDTVTYDIYFGTISPLEKIMSNHTMTSFDLTELSYNTTYYWKIIAWDNNNAKSEGMIWDFTTIPVPNDPPLIKNPDPSDDDIDIEVGINELRILIEDPDDDSFSWSITTSPNIGSSYGTYEENGIKKCIIQNLKFNTTYKWTVSAIDEEGSNTVSKKEYTFKTRPANVDLEISFLKSIYITNIDAAIKNTGEKDLTNINWNIKVEGGIFGNINIDKTGVIDNLNTGETERITTLGSDSMIVFRFGPIDITIEANVEDETYKESKKGFVIGRIILLF